MFLRDFPFKKGYLLNIYAARDRKFVAILDREKCILYRVFSKMQTKQERYSAAPILYPRNLLFYRGIEERKIEES